MSKDGKEDRIVSRTLRFCSLFNTSYALLTSLNCSSAAFLSAWLTSCGNLSGCVCKARLR